MKKFKFIGIYGTEHRAEVLTLPAKGIELNKIQPIHFLHDKNEADRRRKLGESLPNRFKITCLADLPLDDDVAEDEKAAERIVSYERLVITDASLNVIHGHEAVLKARELNRDVIVLKITAKLSKKDIFLIQFRHAAKEGMLFPSIRWEAIRMLHDDHGISLQDIRDLMNGPKNKKPTLKDTLAELRVGRFFEKHSGRKIPHRGFEFDKHSFSNLKYLVGNSSIFEEMSKSPEKELHFLDMAIIATKSRHKRLNTVIPPLMKHHDTRDLLYTNGIDVAKDLQKAKYPEENNEHHPQNDLIAANEKLSRTETLLLLKKQLEVRPATNKFFQQVLAMINTVSEISPQAHREILRTLMTLDPGTFTEMIVDNNLDLVMDAIGAKQQKFGKVLSRST